MNVACGKAVPVNEIIDKINEVLGKAIEPIHTDPRPGDIKHSLADISLARRLLGYEPKVSFQEGLDKAIGWYRDNLT